MYFFFRRRHCFLHSLAPLFFCYNNKIVKCFSRQTTFSALMFRHTTVCLTFVSIKVSGHEGGGERRFSYDSDVEWSDYVVSRLLSRIQNFLVGN